MVAEPLRSAQRSRDRRPPPYTRPRGRSGRGPPARPVDGDLLARHRAVAHPRARSRDRRVATTSAPPARSTPSRSRSRSRTCSARSSPTRRSRPRSSPSSASCSRRASASAPGASPRALFWLMLLGLGGADGALHRDRAVDHRAVRRPGGIELAVGLSRVLFPIVVAARRVRDRRRDPEQLRALHGSGASPGLLERRDHRRAPDRRPAGGHGSTTKLYVYAFSILIGDRHPVAAAAARGCAGATAGCDVVIDWRDPAVSASLVLMVPVTLGLGLINFNAVVDTFFAVAADRPGPRADARSTRRSASTCSRRGYSPSPSQPCSSRRSHGSPLAPTWTASETRSPLGIRQIAFLLVPASVVCAVLASRSSALIYQHGDSSLRTDARRCRRARGILARACPSTDSC